MKVQFDSSGLAVTSADDSVFEHKSSSYLAKLVQVFTSLNVIVRASSIRTAVPLTVYKL
jgi:hypothetical protein